MGNICQTKDNGDPTSYEQIVSTSEMMKHNINKLDPDDEFHSPQTSPSKQQQFIHKNLNQRHTRKAYKNYRIGITKAYLHDIHKLFNKNDNDSFDQITSSITNLIIDYLPPYYLIYGIGKNLITNNEMSDFQRLYPFETKLSSLNDIFLGHNKYFIKSYISEIYGIGSNSFDGLCLNSVTATTTTTTNDDDKNKSYYDLKHICSIYKYFNYVDLNEQIDIISNSIYSNDIIIKLKNGSIYMSELGMNVMGQWNRKFYKPSFDDLSINQHLDIIEIECGLLHSLFLANNGTVYAQGQNNNGQCGFGYLSQRENKIKIITSFIEENVKIKSIKCGQHHSATLDEHGNVWTWGLNKNNQCIPKNNKDSSLVITKPTMVYINADKIIKIGCGESFTVFLDEKGIYGGFGKIVCSSLDRMNITDWNNAKKIKFKDLSCGNNHIILISLDGLIYMHGSNEYYKLGLKIGRAGNPTKTIYNQLPKDLQVCKVIAGMNNSIIIFNST